MSRIAVLPPVAVALGGGAAVLFVLLTAGAPGGPALWAVLAGALALAVMAVATAAVAARRAAHSVTGRVEELRRQVAEQAEERRAAAGESTVSDPPDGAGAQASAPAPGGPATDAFGRLAEDLERAHRETLEVLSRRAATTDGTTDDEAPADEGERGTGVEHRIEVFVNVARRLQSLAHREIAVLDELEREIEDPDLLRGLFHVDHLATRVRRHAENLAVLGGAVSRRQWSEPVALEEVLRSAVAEVEQYARVRVVPPVEGTLRGHAVADVIHLLAELVENATVFSPPHTQVAIRADAVAAGLAVEVEDRGLGMPSEEQERMNALLADPGSVDVAGLLADGRIGLYVVSQLARRHGVRVRLGGNIYGGVQAVLVLPQTLLGPPSAELPPAAEDAPADLSTAGDPAGTGEWRLPGHAARHGGRPDSAADADAPGAPAWHGARPETVSTGPVPVVSGRGECGPLPVVEPEPGPGPAEAVLFAPRPAPAPVLSVDLPPREETPWGGDCAPGERLAPSAPEREAELGAPGADAVRPTPPADQPWDREAEGAVGPAASSSGADARRPDAGPDGPVTMRYPSAEQSFPADAPWSRTPDPLGSAEHAAPVAPDRFAEVSGTPPHGIDPWRSAGDAPADRPGAAPIGPPTPPYEEVAEHLDLRAAWPEPEPSPERAAAVEAPVVQGPSRSDVAGRPGEEDAWPVPVEASAPQARGEDSAARSDRPASDALPEAWWQATRAPEEATQLVPSPRHGEHAAPRAGSRGPLPVRERDGRATPAGALPGMRPAAPPGTPTAPGALTAQEPSVAVPPPLPRRRAQSHLAPQLRSRPTPRADAEAIEEEAGHDPHLMAAFRRGVGLAEAYDAEFPGPDAGAATGHSAGTTATTALGASGATDGRDTPTGL
ncbi:ATP-binding protein [Streptomyces sp. NPDC056600]|uniref:sensor histidine kinase n=1 Tax=Streptomyces sp. NPDC056600 TaxID=3345874 RepID=UPI0036A30D1C